MKVPKDIGKLLLDSGWTLKHIQSTEDIPAHTIASKGNERLLMEYALEVKMTRFSDILNEITKENT